VPLLPLQKIDFYLLKSNTNSATALIGGDERTFACEAADNVSPIFFATSVNLTVDQALTTAVYRPRWFVFSPNPR
jgi:hypothetical protein